MRLLEALASIFINTFGITQPTDKTRRQAAWFIMVLLVLAVVLATTVFIIVYHVIRH